MGTNPINDLNNIDFFDNFRVKGQFYSTLTALKNRRWIATIRSPIDFGHYKKFSLPKSKNELSERVSGNYSYFLTNYVIILLFTLAYSILTRPFLLIFLLAFCYFWLVVSKKEQINITDTIKIKGKVKYSIFITSLLTNIRLNF